MTDPREALERARTHSPFLREQIGRQPDLCALLADARWDAAQDYASAQEGPDMAATLRKRRYALALTVAIADLSGAWDLTQVTQTLSDFADEALDRALEAAFAERYECDPRGFAVIGLGKHGGRELNYSSDIDPIFLFDPDVIPTRKNEDPQEAAVRIGRRAIELLSQRTEHGFVFRVDMRLRPFPEVSPLAIPIDTALTYYESTARTWEQAAFIRARAAAGDCALGQSFLDQLTPFVWRRSLDFGQIDNVAALSRQIRQQYREGQSFGPGYDVKRGRGGIRECEFFAQVQQLIHGGRDEELRCADTRRALKALAEAGLVPAEDAQTIASAYGELRRVEHRLQMMHDRQTHELPSDDETLDAVAQLDGFADREGLFSSLRPHVDAVEAIYDSFTEEGQEEATALPLDEVPLADALVDRGFADPAQARRMIERWRSGKVRAIRSAAARDAFERILPELMSALGGSPDPERAVARFDSMVEQLPTGINFFHLLDKRPGLLQQIALVFALAPTLADALARRAELLDGLIDATAMQLPGDVDSLIEELRGPDRDYQDLLDVVRSRVGEYRFALGVQMISGVSDPLDVTEGYARVAEAALNVLAEATIAEFEAVHGRIANAELSILALGRLGGGALTHASDLDLVFLHIGETDQKSDGERALGTTQYFNRLAQRIVGAMTVQTAAGPLYEVDTRLRPSGSQGLLCPSVDGFERYQRESAWTWEHMALCRARPVYGSEAARERLAQSVHAVLAQPRDGGQLLTDITDMRRRIAKDKKPRGSIDAKQLPGGLVDIEFITHFLQLRDGIGLHPGVEKAIASLLEREQVAPCFADAHLFLTRFLALVRLVAPGCDVPPVPAQSLVAELMHLNSWDELTDQFDRARKCVIHEWLEALGPHPAQSE